MLKIYNLFFIEICIISVSYWETTFFLLIGSRFFFLIAALDRFDVSLQVVFVKQYFAKVKNKKFSRNFSNIPMNTISYVLYTIYKLYLILYIFYYKY